MDLLEAMEQLGPKVQLVKTDQMVQLDRRESKDPPDLLGHLVSPLRWLDLLVLR
jgi:hypothetical protein